MKRFAWIAGFALVLMAALAAALIAFGTTSAPASSGIVGAFRGTDFSALPAVERYTARDGALLGYRRYPAVIQGTGSVMVLIHGASDSGLALFSLARTLAEAGVTTYVPEGRGHGISRPRGDIGYVGQLDDDLSDLVASVGKREGEARWLLAGFSSGGGFVLRFADGPNRGLFARYLLLAPGLAYQGPLVRPKPATPSPASSFATPFMPRLIGLAAVNAVGIHAFDGLPVIAFAVPADSPVLTRTYSLRMLNNLMPIDYVKAIGALAVPTAVFIGENDEFSVPTELVRAFGGKTPPIGVYVLPGVNHTGLVTSPTGIAAIRAWALSG